MTIREIKEGSQVIARWIPADDAWGEGLKFFSSDRDFVQVGTWGYSGGKELLAHAHNPVSREVQWTQEVLFVRRGSLRADIYDSGKNKVAEWIVKQGDIVVLLGGGHGYQILTDGTQVLEIKNGPYLGAETDRTRL
jgi:hypothetical protein